MVTLGQLHPPSKLAVKSSEYLPLGSRNPWFNIFSTKVHSQRKHSTRIQYHRTRQDQSVQVPLDKC